MKILALPFLLAPLLAAPVFAQGTCETVGDPCGIPWLSCSGAPDAGVSFSLEAPGTPGQPMFLALGELLAHPALVPFPTSCIPPGCDLYVQPSALLTTTVGGSALGLFTFDVPPGAVGLSFGAQAGTLSPGQPCYYASPALEITVGP